jgi:hypothetical protein
VPFQSTTVGAGISDRVNSGVFLRGIQVALCLDEPKPGRGRGGGDEGMLETIAIILIILWLLGMVSGYTLGNFIWVLLVIAVVLFLVRLIGGRRVV